MPLIAACPLTGCHCRYMGEDLSRRYLWRRILIFEQWRDGQDRKQTHHGAQATQGSFKDSWTDHIIASSSLWIPPQASSILLSSLHQAQLTYVANDTSVSCWFFWAPCVCFSLAASFILTLFLSCSLALCPSPLSLSLCLSDTDLFCLWCVQSCAVWASGERVSRREVCVQ